MAEDEPFSIQDYRKGAAATTPCPKCGELIPASATQCRACGLHFRGQAGDFAPEAQRYSESGKGFSVAAKVVLGVFILAVLLGLIAFVLTRG